MDLPRSAALAASWQWRDAVGSTNDELVALAAAPSIPLADRLPDFSVLATDVQTAGRGRLGRVWVAPPHTALAVSLLLRPAFPAAGYGWLPLVAGAAMTRAVRAAAAVGGMAAADRVNLKWPNDVRIGDRKLCGILAEVLPDGSGIVIGAGINTRLAAHQLPVPTATSLTLEGIDVAADDLIGGYLREVRGWYDALSAADGDALSSGVHGAVSRLCGTLGQRVRAELPSGQVVQGRAVSLDAAGRLEIVMEGPARRLAVAAGDVTHLRY